MKIWTCKIGQASGLPHGADLPMRKAIAKAYRELTGQEPDFIFSGWGGTLTEAERAVVDDALPAHTEPCALPPDHEEDHSWARREAAEERVSRALQSSAVALDWEERQVVAIFLKAYIHLCGSRIPGDHPVHTIAAKLSGEAAR